MAEQYRFFGSAEGDTRQYNQTEFAEVLSRLLRNGYFPEVDNELEVVASDPLDMSVEVLPGQAWINGYWYKNDNNKILNINPAHATLNRIDRVVLRLDVVNSRKITAMVIQGTAASNPAPPTLTRTSQIYEISLAQVYIAAGTTSISQIDITDERDNIDVCGKAVPYYVPTNDDIVTTAEPNKILRLDSNAQLPASADMLDGKHATDFQSANKSYGYVEYNESLAPQQIVTKYIPIGSGKKFGLAIFKAGHVVFKGGGVQVEFDTDPLNTKAIIPRIGSVTRRRLGYVTYWDLSEPGINIGIDDMYIEGSNIVVKFRNGHSSDNWSLRCRIDWEVW